MHRRLIIGFFFSLFMAQLAVAQDKGKVVVIKDPQIDSLISKRLELSRGARGGINVVTSSGFRVQIFAGLERDEAYAEQAKFRSLFPGVPSYMSYTQPYYKIRVGDFRTRLEAQKFMNGLKRQYPSVFIFAEKINPR